MARGSGPCWQALSKLCPTAEPFGMQASPSPVKDLQHVFHLGVGQLLAQLLLGCWDGFASMPLDWLFF